MMSVMRRAILLQLAGLICWCAACTESTQSRQQDRPVPGSERTVLATVSRDLQHGNVVFSPEAKRAGYIVFHDKKQRMVLDGRQGKPYDSVKEPVFSPDGGKLAYVAVSDKRWFIVVDGKEGQPYDEVANPVFSPDSRLAAYEARKGDQWFIVVGEHESAGSNMHSGPPVFSPDSKYVFYVEQDYAKNKAYRVVSEIGMKRALSRHEYDNFGVYTFSPDGSRVAYVTGKDGEWKVVVSDFGGQNKDRSEAFDEILTRPVFSSDGTRVAYAAERKGVRFLIKNDKAVALGDLNWVGAPVFSPDLSEAAFVLERGGKQQVIVDGKEGPQYDEIGRPVFSADSSRIAYPARKGERWQIAVDGGMGPSYDVVVTPQFSRDGSRVIYRARQGGKRFVVVADDRAKTVRQHPSMDAIWQPELSKDGKTMNYGAVEGQEILQVKVPIE